MSKSSGTHLKASDVRYLAFEGGGAKGAAYLGTMVALENLKILNWTTHSRTKRRILDNGKIKGLSGASAGSIIATLLSCGYTISEFGNIMDKINKEGLFFDAPTPIMRPTVNLEDLSKRPDSCQENRQLRYPNLPMVLKILFSRVLILEALRQWLSEKTQGTKPLELDFIISQLISAVGLAFAITALITFASPISRRRWRQRLPRRSRSPGCWAMKSAAR